MPQCPYCDRDLKIKDKKAILYCNSCKTNRLLEIEKNYPVRKSEWYKYRINKNPTMMMILSSIIIVLLLCIPVVNILIIDFNKKEKKIEDNWRDWPLDSNQGYEQGYIDEFNSINISIEISEKYVTEITFQLSWLDEHPESPRYINEPDCFEYSVISPWSETFYSELSCGYERVGEIILNIEISDDHVEEDATGQWIVTIKCGECGDQSHMIGIAAFRQIPDTGNDWSLSYEFLFHSKDGMIEYS